MKTKLHFSRFEFKYVLPLALREELETQFQYFVELDPYVAQKPGAKYFVRSLYYDNAALDNYWEKEDGQKHRAKFRVRTYTSDVDEVCPRFLEIKGRHNNLVFKHRTKVDGTGQSPAPGSLLRHQTTGEILAGLEEGPIKEQFKFELDRKRLGPVMLVDYWRRPYISKFDPEFRMTFDDTLRGTDCGELFPSALCRTREALPGYTILEVKFRFHVPKWFHRLIQTMELQRVSISKYCRCVEAHGLVD
ncbi:MAG: polyphosphate polymerase domain-containing protein [bacterium]|nr:polyphosphate polymerase domain-containing protein [bacterium]